MAFIVLAIGVSQFNTWRSYQTRVQNEDEAAVATKRLLAFQGLETLSPFVKRAKHAYRHPNAEVTNDDWYVFDIPPTLIPTILPPLSFWQQLHDPRYVVDDTDSDHVAALTSEHSPEFWRPKELKDVDLIRIHFRDDDDGSRSPEIIAADRKTGRIYIKTWD